MKEISIHKRSYNLNDDEFEVIEKKDFYPMVIRTDVSYCDREIGLLKKLSSTLGLNELFCTKVRFGGYIPLNLLTSFSVININCDRPSVQTITTNLQKYDTFNKIRIVRYSTSNSVEYELSVENEIGIVITREEEQFDSMYKVLYCDKFLYISSLIWTEFRNNFGRWLVNEDQSVRLVYDNLINLLIMVKDAGDGFREILTANKPYIDKWTILDTGSTDNTVSIIREVFSGLDGNLYEEPFINFRDSRNRLLELAGDDCAFNIMIDDTYVLNGNLREFLMVARGDDEADSFSLFITDPEIEYSSNRITKPERRLKYKYKIHEIIEKNENMCIPRSIAWINDVTSSYMSTRTNNRKQRDIELLQEELDENPDDPRNLYYMGETYYCIKDWENAFNYYKLRSESDKEGFNEEVYDSLFKMALISERYFETSWDQVEIMYMRCFEADKTVPTPLFMIGHHYLLNGDQRVAYDYFKQIMQLPPVHKNMNTRPIIKREYVPKFLLPLCFQFEDYELGLICSEILLSNFKGNFNFQKWKQIYILFLVLKQENRLENPDLPKLEHDKKLICFVDNGGWSNWDGETLQTKGLGGSETWTIEYAETLALKDTNEVVVFCRCDDVKVFKNVSYIPIQNFIKFALSNVIDFCLVSRFSEYLFLCTSNLFSISKLYFVLHDISIEGDMVPITNKLTGVLCISEWQKQQFLSMFPVLSDKTHVISYGIETSNYQSDLKLNNYSFIYPSFPNRGLLYLLRMFPKIVERYPSAKLNVFCRFDLDYLNDRREEMNEIQSLIQSQSANVINHGWVNRKTLNRHWSEADIWFYPCVFAETCCRVAMEASASKTFVICNDLAALNETVGKRGAIIPGNPTTEEWQQTALTNLFFVLDNKLENIFIERNYKWVQTKSYLNVVNDFENRFLQVENESELTKVVFPLDNRVSVDLIDHPYSEKLLSRNNLEPKFRSISTYLINQGLIRNILDSGAFIGDNSIPWAKNVQGMVFAIDPSAENCSFIRDICKFNNIENMKIFPLALNDKNELLSTDEDLHHCTLVNSGKNNVESVSLDYLFDANEISNVDYIHLDVEGMEYKVITGGTRFISSCRPIIAFEQHLLTDNYNQLCNFLKDRNYTVFLIDEVLEGCKVDCRNFIAFPNEKCSSELFNLINSNVCRLLEFEKVTITFDSIESKLRNIQSELRLDYGSFDEEYPQQLMACQFLNGTENVLEIGGNIGRNSLIIASILNRNNNTNFVSMECNLSIAEQLEHNKNQNNLQFSIEKCALSKRNLIQKTNDWQTHVSNVVLNGYNSVRTITWDNLCLKYPFTFDTLVLDCEGAFNFYYILKDMPKILTNINKILMENDYWEIMHKNYIDNKLKENGFNLVYSKEADQTVNMPCRNFFYQVWIKG